MSAADNTEKVRRIFLDTAPVIYYIERNPDYFDLVKIVFEHIDDGLLTAVTSPITLAECLVVPYRSGQIQLQRDFFDLIVLGSNTVFSPIGHDKARQAAMLRAHYNITLTDALQVAIAMTADCDAFLTNDIELKRLTELCVLLPNDLEAFV